MIQKKISLCLGLLAGMAAMASCAFDNTDEPSSQLTGKIVYQSKPVGLRHGKVVFDLYQDGYKLNQPIPLYVSYDGSFSAMLFDGSYRLVARNNNGPWINDTTPVSITVAGSTLVDYNVTPYYILSDVNIVLSGTTVTGVCNVRQIEGGKTLQGLSLLIGKRPFVDNDSYNYIARKNTFPVNVGGNTVTLDIGSHLNDNTTTLYARFGLQISGVGEGIYSDVFKLK